MVILIKKIHKSFRTKYIIVSFYKRNIRYTVIIILCMFQWICKFRYVQFVTNKS